MTDCPLFYIYIYIYIHGVLHTYNFNILYILLSRLSLYKGFALIGNSLIKGFPS